MSMRVAPEYIPVVEKALLLSRYPSKKCFAHEIGLSRSTITSFFRGKAVSNLNFIDICTQLGLNWEEIVDQANYSSAYPPLEQRKDDLVQELRQLCYNKIKHQLSDISSSVDVRDRNIIVNIYVKIADLDFR